MSAEIGDERHLWAERTEQDQIAHEARTSLTVIKGYVQLLLLGKEQMPDHVQHEYLIEIQEASNQLSVLLARIFDRSVDV